MDDRRVWLDRLRSPAVGLVVCLMATVALYAPHVLSAGFVYEDLNDINTTYRPWQGVAVELHDAVVRPARALTRAVDRSIGLHPMRQHAASLGWHLIAGLLFWRVVQGLLGPWQAVFAVGLFWLAPWQTEAVAYAAARADVLMTVAVLAGLWAVRTDQIALAWGAAVAAILAKETGVVAWLLLPAFAWWLGRAWSMRWKMAWTLTMIGGFLAALATREPDTAQLLPVVAVHGLTQLAGLLLTPPWALTIDPAPASIWALAGCVVIALAIWRASSGLALAVVGGLVLAWLPRILVPLQEPPHFHHLYLPATLLSLGLARLFQKGPLTNGD